MAAKAGINSAEVYIEPAVLAHILRSVARSKRMGNKNG